MKKYNTENVHYYLKNTGKVKFRNNSFSYFYIFGEDNFPRLTCYLKIVTPLPDKYQFQADFKY